MPKNFVSYDNAEDLMEGINSKKVSKSDLTSIFATGSTNTTGSVITSGTYFYLNGILVKAISDIAVGDTFTEDTNYEVITDGALNESSGSGGHTIEDAAGNVLQQQDTMQFLGGLKATNDPTNGKTKIDDTPTLVTWAEWNAMTPEQRAAIPKAQITNVPGADGTISAEVFKELWRNPSPTVNFAQQTITLSSDDYDFLLICMKDSNGTCSVDRLIYKDFKTNYIGISISMSGNSSQLRTRVFGKTDDTHIIAADAYQTLMSSPTSATVNNGILIPNVIYGIKKTLSLDFSAIASDVSTLASKCMLSDGETSVEDALTYKYVYSTTEHIVGKWIDGSDLYEKTIDFGQLSNATRKSVAHNISNLNYVLDISGIAYRSNDHVSVPIPRASGAGSSTHTVDVYVDTTHVNITPTSNYSDYDKTYITLRYTKTS